LGPSFLAPMVSTACYFLSQAPALVLSLSDSSSCPSMLTELQFSLQKVQITVAAAPWRKYIFSALIIIFSWCQIECLLSEQLRAINIFVWKVHYSLF
jgi:hypothetical protein